MKIINYFFFLLGIWFGTQNLQRNPRDIYYIRTMLLAYAAFIVLGSLALIPFPNVSYATTLFNSGANLDEQTKIAIITEMKELGEKTLFCGITNHSQTLAPLLALLFAWILCDMLFVEKCFRWGHILLMALIPPMLFMTRSRVAFVTFTMDLLLINFYTLRRISVAPGVRRKMGNGLWAFMIVVIAALCYFQIRSRTVSKWLRKEQDVAGDTRTLTEAMTSSRMGLIEQSMWEFKRNPVFGSGFQVAWYHKDLDRRGGLILSASIEKGVLPTMVLGETGIVGSLCFLFFLFAFYHTCARRRLYVTITLFSLLLTANMGEATFFSPGGMGGVLYILTVVGGFMIDTMLLYERNMKQFAALPKPNNGLMCREYWPAMHGREIRWK